MNVSAILNYRVEDGVKAYWATDNLEQYIQNQGLEVIKSVCGLFAYMNKNVDQEGLSLMADTGLVGEALKYVMQSRLDVVGVEVISMELMEVSYSPEVA